MSIHKIAYQLSDSLNALKLLCLVDNNQKNNEWEKFYKSQMKFHSAQQQQARKKNHKILTINNYKFS